MSDKNILIDIGSSTVKAGITKSGQVQLLAQKSIPFKKDFDSETGISASSKKELFEFVKKIKEENPNTRVKTFATALYRKMSRKAKTHLVDEFYQETQEFFNVIDHDLESFYLEVALVGRANLSEKVLLINIGGGSTELVVVEGNKAVERLIIDLGVGTINAEFPKINDPLSGENIDKIISFVKAKLPKLQSVTKIAFYTGGELTFMQLANYRLIKNTFFTDENHPLTISLKNFSQKNSKIFSEVNLSDLEKLVPDNPSWMHGARGCSAIAQAISEFYGIDTLIPSNSNLLDGVARQEFRKVTISGSFRKYLDYILKIRTDLKSRGAVVLSPRFVEPKNPGDEFVVFAGEEGESPLVSERHHLNSIQLSDALIVCDPDGYVGASALIEIGFAQSLGKRIIFTEKPLEFMLVTLPSEVGIY